MLDLILGRFKFLIIGALICLISLFSSVFFVYEGSQAIVLQFGKLVSDSVLKPGLHFKVPFIQDVIFFESRILDLAPESREVIAADQKRIIVDAYAKYRIFDPLLFYQTVGYERNLQARLNPILESRLREEIGKVSLLCLLSECRSRTMDLIHRSVGEQARGFGVEVVDVRIKRTDLPEANSNAIFRRMQTAREKEAREIRAQGIEESKKVIGEADKQRLIILSEARRQSEVLKGNGDAEAASIYAKAYAVDPDFFDFVRHMHLYKEALGSDSTKYVLSGNESFLDFMKYKK